MTNPDPTAPALETGEVRANGLTFRYLAAGRGPLALCLHGFPDCADGWTPVLHALAGAGYRAVAPYMRGYAPTEVPADGRYQSGVLVADANALHETLGGDEQAVVIGHDWGAFAAYGAPRTAPDRWAKAVASAGTRAMAPPSTRSCATRIVASDARRCSRIVSATSRTMASTNNVVPTAVGWYESSSGG